MERNEVLFQSFFRRFAGIDWHTAYARRLSNDRVLMRRAAAVSTSGGFFMAGVDPSFQ
jgi:hypothetical protein